MKKLLRELVGVSLFKTLFVNFRVLPFKQAIKLPIIVSRHVKIDGALHKNAIVINGSVRPGCILFGIGGSRNLAVCRRKRSYLRINGKGRIVFEGTAHFAPNFTLLVDNAMMQIGSGFSCNNGCMFLCFEGMTFGTDCLFGRDVEIRDSDGHFILEPDEQGRFIEKINKKPVRIGNHVWLCTNVRILKGVEIDDDCVVAYSSICTKPIAGKGKLIAGYPAKVIKESIGWKK